MVTEPSDSFNRRHSEFNLSRRSMTSKRLVDDWSGRMATPDARDSRKGSPRRFIKLRITDATSRKDKEYRHQR